MADDFDPDAYLSQHENAPVETSTQDSGFNPDAYLATHEQAPDLSQEGKFNSNTVGFDKSYAPFGGATEAFGKGYEDITKARKMAFGDNPIDNAIGSVQGAIGGAAMAAGTALNPVSKVLSFGKNAQAISELASGEEGNALNTIRGTRDVRPDLHPHAFNTGSQLLDTGLNMADELGVTAQKNPELLLSGLGPTKGVAIKSALDEAAAARAPSLTTTDFGDHMVKGGKFVEPAKVVPKGFARTIASAFADNLPRNMKVDAFQKAAEIAAPELHRTAPNISNASMFSEAVKSTQKRAGEFLNSARQSLGLPDYSTSGLVDGVTKSLMSDDAITSRFTPEEIAEEVQKQTKAMTTRFPKLNPDQLQDIATDRKNLAGPTVDQLNRSRETGKPSPLDLNQHVNLAIHDELRGALDAMYEKTPGADYARKVYGATKTLEAGVSRLTEKLARQALKDDPTLAKAISSPGTLLGGAMAAAGHLKAGGATLLVKGAQVLHKLHADHLIKPNTKISNAFTALRKNMEVVPTPEGYTPPPMPRIGPPELPQSIQAPMSKPSMGPSPYDLLMEKQRRSALGGASTNDARSSGPWLEDNGPIQGPPSSAFDIQKAKRSALGPMADYYQ